MGAYYFGVPKDLAKFIHEQWGLDIFVETGTFLGNTAAWAKTLFNKVISIELSRQLHKEVVQKFEDSGIHFLQGSSAKLLKGLTRVSTPMLFWLDAHWSGGRTSGEGIPCPLLEELDIILTANEEHIILIDDARFITAPPPPQLEKVPPETLPSLDSVFCKLNSYGERYNIIWRDVIISVPLHRANALYSFICKQPDIHTILQSHAACFSERAWMLDDA